MGFAVLGEAIEFFFIGFAFRKSHDFCIAVRCIFVRKWMQVFHDSELHNSLFAAYQNPRINLIGKGCANVYCMCRHDGMQRTSDCITHCREKMHPFSNKYATNINTKIMMVSEGKEHK